MSNMGFANSGSSYRRVGSRSWALPRIPLGIAKPRGWNSVIAPAVFAGVAVALLVYDHVHRQVTDVVFWLSLVLVAAIFVWLVSKTAAAVARERGKALADELTGLGNGRKLETDLAAALAPGAGEGWLLVLVGLDGVPAYNDRYGHAAGDELLRGFARGLSETAAGLGGVAYRAAYGGFALVIPLRARLPSAVSAAVAATPLECNDEHLVSTSYAEVSVPDEAPDSKLALQIATQRLAARKQRQRQSARGQVRDVLLAVLAARRASRADHPRDLAQWIVTVGRKLGLDREQLDDIVLAAELREIGLLTVPETTLAKRSDLDAREVELVRRHPIAGERILNAASTLAPVAALVRAANEHVDGSGFPDGLVGQAIPLGARIIAVCAAFSNEQHAGRSISAACEELECHVGTQFDHNVVAALVGAAGEPAGTPTPSPI
jgi:diguanylate cyclase (GGDEF)-like protein